MGNSLDKIHSTAAYSNQDADSLLDIERLEKLHVTASYSYQDADSLLDVVRFEKTHVTAAYRDVNAGHIDLLLFDKVHITAVYRYQEGGFEPPESPPPQNRRSQNINFGIWPFTLLGVPVLTAVKDQPYEGFTVTTRSEKAPVIYFLDGDWPVGLSIDSEGNVAGTPIEFGTFSGLSIFGVDNNLNEARLLVGSIEVTEFAELVISGTPVLTATENSPYDGFTVSAVGGLEPYVFSLVGDWPTGLSIDPDTGVVSGTPTEFGSFIDLSVRVTDANSNTDDLTLFSLEVEEEATAPINTSLPVISGSPISGETLSTTDGVWDDGGSEISGYTYQWKADGVDIDGATSSTFELTDTQIGAVITVTVTATNAAGSTSATSEGTDAVEAAGGLILDGLSPTGAWSFSRDLLTSFAGGTRYTTSTGVNAFNDQSGNSRNFAPQFGASSEPALTTAGPNSRACADFDGSNDGMQSAALSNFIANNSGWMVVSFIADSITLNNAARYQNHSVFGDGNSGFAGIFLSNTDADVGDPDTIHAYNWDGNADVTSEIGVVVGTAYVAAWRHEGGNLYLSLNGGAEVSVASGNTSTMTGTLKLGSNGNFGGKIFECATFSTVPSSGDRAAIVADMMAWVTPTPSYRHHNFSAVFSTTTNNVTYPTGLAAGDIMLLSVVYDTNGGTGVSLNVPSGFTLIGTEQTPVSGVKTALLWGRATGSESGSLSVTLAGTMAASRIFYCILAAYSGCLASGDPIDDFSETTSSTNPGPATMAALTTTGANRRCVAFFNVSFFGWNGTRTSGPASGWTQRGNHASTAGFDGGMIIDDAEQASAGSPTNDTWDCSSNTTMGVHAIALKPEPAG